MGETTKNILGYVAMAFTLIPAMIVSGFFPEWDVLPFSTWVIIASIGTGLVLSLIVPKWYKGMIVGIIAALGVLYGLHYYVILRTELTGSYMVMRIEIILAALIGGFPALLLFFNWANK